MTRMAAGMALPGPGPRHLVDSYLAEVTARLPGPTRARASVVDELRAGLLDAIDAYRSAGLTAEQATQAAAREFGDPCQVADAFRPGLALSQARGVATTLVATGPLIGLLWAAAAKTSHLGIRAAPPWQWPGAPPGSLVAFPLAAAAFAVTIWAALLTVAATGHLTRWLPVRAHLATATAAIAGFGAMAVDLIIFVLLASQLAVAPGTLAPAPVAIAATASLIRLTLARRAGRRCLAARAALS
jgi:hypothetical protein